MGILLDYYCRYRAEGLLPPESVQQSSAEYSLDNDHYKRFCDKHLVFKANEFVSSANLKATFNEWGADQGVNWNTRTSLGKIETVFHGRPLPPDARRRNGTHGLKNYQLVSSVNR